MPVPDPEVLTEQQAAAAAALLRSASPHASELGELFATAGHQLALVGGPVRDAFLGRPPGDIDLTTDARPDQILAIVAAWSRN